MNRQRRASSSVLHGAAAGAIGGIVGSAVMVGFNHLVAATGFGEDDRGEHHQHRRVDAKPNDTDGTISDEPASIKVAGMIGELILGAPLNERQKSIGGSLVHHTFGAVTGALYGATAARTPGVAAGAGLPFGAAVWLTADETGLPLVGLASHPAKYPVARHVAALATHLLFGLTVEAVRRALMPRCSRSAP